MSIVKYVNKKTGRVAVYESTSNYDPVTKQSRPKRKYLGMEDPETGELIPSSGKRGRKRNDDSETTHSKNGKEENYKAKYEKLLTECREKEDSIKKLEHENKKLNLCLEKLREIISKTIDAK